MEKSETIKINWEEFWKLNQKCLDLKGPRVPVVLPLGGDWICEYLKLDNAKYYSDFDYQQEARLKCGEITRKELGLAIQPDIDFGVVMDASIYGGRVNYEANATPTLVPVVQEPQEIDALVDEMMQLDEKDLLERGLVPKYLEWREKIKMKYGIDICYGDSIKGCATTLGQICGITNFLTWILTDSQQIAKLVACWVETAIRYVRAMRKATAFPENRRGFALYSDLTGMLSPELYRTMLMNAEKRIYECFAPLPQDVRYYHADYRMLHQLDALREIGVNRVNVDPYVSPKDILEKMPEVIVVGQVPPNLLLNGTPQEITECVKRDIEQAGRQLIASTVGSIVPGTSFENMKVMCCAVEKYGYVY
ncbi:MAG: uroporphyrinogen decarboxylase [Candidatus Atribacteria bacterium]|nr:uroporphyrinogen decarboxylase [Candidatus Atribacteria bacterium]